MKRIATLLLVFFATTSTTHAQTVETVLVSPQISDYLALDKATGDLYTTNYNQVSRISPDGTIEVVADATTFITGIGVSAAGDVYFSDSGLFTQNPVGSVYKIDSSGNVTEFASGLADIIGIWMSQDDDGFYTQSYGGTIYFISFDGTVSEIYTELEARMTDIVLDEAGNIYIAYFDFGRIDKIAPDGTLSELATIPSWLGYMSYVNGYIFATGWQANQVFRVDTATGEALVVAGTGDPGLEDGGATEAQFHDPNGIVASVTGDTLYVTDIETNALRRIVGATSVNIEAPTDLPNAFALGQSYPNPFNPVTTIPYTLHRNGQVTLKVIDLLGRTVETLVSQTQTAGHYSVTWDARNQSSGVYLYRLETEDFIKTRQMMLLK